MLNDDQWVTGSDGGALALWSAQKKKPLDVLPNAHGRHCLMDGEVHADIFRESANDNDQQQCMSAENTVTNPHWICAVAAAPYSDWLATGSSDGYIRLWKVSRVVGLDDEDDDDDEDHVKNKNKETFTLLQRIPVTGFVNALQFSPSGKYLVAAVGQEHKQGRWMRIKEARNSIHLFPIEAKASKRTDEKE
jgi:ribosomal RNA-processing protein 9